VFVITFRGKFAQRKKSLPIYPFYLTGRIRCSNVKERDVGIDGDWE